MGISLLLCGNLFLRGGELTVKELFYFAIGAVIFVGILLKYYAYLSKNSSSCIQSVEIVPFPTNLEQESNLNLKNKFWYILISLILVFFVVFISSEGLLNGNLVYR